MALDDVEMDRAPGEHARQLLLVANMKLFDITNIG